MDQWISVLVALVCVISPSISRSWVGPQDLYDVDHDDELKSWYDGPDDYKPNHSWEHSPDFDSSEEDSWERDDDFGDHQAYGHGHGGYPHNHENHPFDHQHSDYGYHHNHHGHDHQGHGKVSDDRKQGHHEHSSRSAGSSGSAKNSHGKTNKNEEKLNVLPTKNVDSPAQVDMSQNNPNKKQVPKNDAGLPLPEGQARSTSTSSLSPPTSLSTTTSSTTTSSTTTSSTTSSTTTASSTTTSAPVTTPAPTAAPSLPTLLDIVLCVRACPSTSEYNPVCGSNNFTYNNPGALECATNCGANVTLIRSGSCARPILQQGSTASPDTKVTVTSAPVTTEVPTTQPPITSAPVTATPTRFTDITAQDLEIMITKMFKL